MTAHTNNGPEHSMSSEHPEVEADFPVIELGFGKVELGGAVMGNLPALFFGRDGQGAVGLSRERYEYAHNGETIAVVTFANRECLEVLKKTLAEVEALFDEEARDAVFARAALSQEAP